MKSCSGCRFLWVLIYEFTIHDVHFKPIGVSQMRENDTFSQDDKFEGKCYILNQKTHSSVNNGPILKL